MGKKLFVGNLSFNTTTADLEALFAQIGACESAAVVTDRATGRSRGFGFVEMASASDAQKAIAELNGRELHGRTINVNEARAIELESRLSLRRSQAAAVIAYRSKNGKFKSLEDLKKVPGVDAAKIEAKKDRIVF